MAEQLTKIRATQVPNFLYNTSLTVYRFLSRVQDAVSSIDFSVDVENVGTQKLNVEEVTDSGFWLELGRLLRFCFQSEFFGEFKGLKCTLDFPFRYPFSVYPPLLGSLPLFSFKSIEVGATLPVEFTYDLVGAKAGTHTLFMLNSSARTDSICLLMEREI